MLRPIRTTPAIRRWNYYELWLRLAIFQAFDQARKHTGDLFQVGFELLVLLGLQEFLQRGGFQQCAAMERAARFNWSARKKEPRGRPRVSVQIASAKPMAIW